MIEKVEWLQYMKHDEEDNLIGLTEDATEEAKKEYEEWLELNKKGIKV
jgi:hypothetical protein